MNKYTYKDIIISPTSKKAKNYIGKMVYFADNPTICLYHANSGYNDEHCGILQDIEIDHFCPFVLEDSDIQWGCIIPKKEEKEII